MSQQNVDVTAQPARGLPVLAEVSAALRRVRSAARRRLFIHAVAGILAAALVIALALVFIDYLVRLPWPMRAGLLIGGVLVCLWRLHELVLPVLRFKPSLTEVALRLEQSEAGRAAGLTGMLAAGLELASEAPSSPLERDLAQKVARDALARFKPSIATSVFVRARTWRALGILLLVFLGVGAWSAARPELARIGAKRLLAPWAGAQWPKRTALADATSAAAQPADTVLPLRAILTRTDREPGRTEVWANYRLITNGHDGPITRVPMTAQNQRAASVIATASGLGGKTIPVTGEMYERLVEPAGLLAGRTSAESDADASPPELEYWFQTADDRTPSSRIALVDRPAVLSVESVITPPAYAAGATATTWWAGPHPVTISESGAAVGPILAGSTVRLRLSLNKPVPQAPEWTDPQAAPDDETQIGGEGASWWLEWHAAGPRRLSVTLADRYGVTSAEDAVFNVDVLADQSPSAAVVDPPRDESVLPTAVFDVIGEGRDDIGLAWASVEYEHIVSGASPAPADKLGPPSVELARHVVSDQDPADDQGRQLRVTATLDLSELHVKPGDEVRVTTLAKDLFAAGDADHAPVRSAARRLRVITESELVEQIQAELAGVRQSAIRLDREQAKIGELSAAQGKDTPPPAELRRRQDAIAESLKPQAQALDRLHARSQRNGLQDRNLDLMLDSAKTIVERAAAQSAAASAAMAKAAAQPAQAAEAAQQTAEAQQSVRDELARLVELLESGKDGWAVRRAIEKLLAEQKELAARTEQIGAQTVGRPAAELSQAQRDELNRLAQQQREAAARAGSAMDQMLTRAKQMAQSDPAQAEALMQAARRAQERGLQEAMEQAADEISKNKTQSGSDYQEQAEESLTQMLREMETTQAKREEVLRRALANLIHSLEQLVHRQETELAALGQVNADQYESLARSMIDVRGRTLAVADDAKAAGRETAKVVGFLAAAGEAQATAITALRASPGDTGTADAQERISRDRLREALNEAKRLDQQSQDRDQARKRAELRQAYREALAAQQDLRAKTAEFVGKNPSRRDRAVVRGLAVTQEAQRQSLDQLRQKTEELKDAKVFQFAHKRLDEVMARAAAALADGEATRAAAADQSAAERMLESLVEALKEDDRKNDFREGSDGGSGSGGQGGQNGEQQPAIPPIAELRLLRMIQQEIADRTRDAGGRAAAETAALIDQLGKDQDALAQQAKELIERMNKPATPDHGGAQ